MYHANDALATNLYSYHTLNAVSNLNGSIGHAPPAFANQNSIRPNALQDRENDLPPFRRS